jgi:hypothetical protein
LRSCDNQGDGSIIGFLAGKNGLGKEGAPADEVKLVKSTTPYIPDEDTVSMLAEQHNVTIDIARAALIAAHGDAITASGKIEESLDNPADTSTLMAREAEALLNKQFEESLQHQQGFAGETKVTHTPAPTTTTTTTATATPAPAKAASTPAPTAAPVVEEPTGPRGPSMTPQQRVDAVYQAMFTYRYAQTYFTAKPRTEAGALQASDVDTCICK